MASRPRGTWSSSRRLSPEPWASAEAQHRPRGTGGSGAGAWLQGAGCWVDSAGRHAPHTLCHVPHLPRRDHLGARGDLSPPQEPAPVVPRPQPAAAAKPPLLVLWSQVLCAQSQVRRLCSRRDDGEAPAAGLLSSGEPRGQSLSPKGDSSQGSACGCAPGIGLGGGLCHTGDNCHGDPTARWQ